MADQHSADAALARHSTPIKSSGYAYGCDKFHHGDLHHLDELSTAAPSTLQSPAGGFARVSPKAPPDLAELGHALAGLGEAWTPETAHQAQLQRRLEWYFSAEHLRSDWYLRSRMDRFGWVPLAAILQLSGIRSLEATSASLLAAVSDSRLLQISGDFRRLRARSPAVWAAFAPRPTAEPSSSVSELSASSPPSCRSDPSFGAAFQEEIDVADEDLTVAASVEPPRAATAASAWPLARQATVEGVGRASKEGEGWPCVEWITSDPHVDEPCLEWLTDEADVRAQWQKRHRAHGSRRHRRRSHGAAVASEYLDYGAGVGAWIHLTDGDYATPAASIRGW